MVAINNDDQARLKALMADAETFVRRSMDKTESVAPTLFVHGAAGQHCFEPKNMTSASGLRDFGDNARLFCLAHGANACVFVATVRLNHSETVGNGYSAPSAHDSISNRDAVILMGETREEWQQRVLLISRTREGNFAGLVASENKHSEALKGYFGQFLTYDRPDEAMRRDAKELLMLNGIIREETRERDKDRSL